MSNVQIIGFNPSLVVGTTGVNGTNSEVFDLGGNTLLGLIADGLTAGTINFEVASYDPAPTSSQIGTLRLLRNLDATVVATGSLSGNIALTADAVRVLAPYRYVRLQFSAQQASGATIRFVMKG